jgi:brefeldin A-resistance guanine nucleotide exchange factor 1
MHALVRSVFSRLHDLDPVAEEKKLQASEDAVQESELKMTVSPTDEKEYSEVTIVAQSEEEEPVATPESQGNPTASVPRSQCVFFTYPHCCYL